MADLALMIAIGEVAGVAVGVLIGWFGHARYRNGKAREYGQQVAAGIHEYRREDYPVLPLPPQVEGHQVGGRP